MSVTLSHNAIGEGQTILILHGLFGSKRNWSSIAKQLSDTYRVLTVDLRNHGESSWSDVHDYSSMAEDVATLIENECSKPPVVLGHSMGGKVAMYLALVWPNLIDRLIVVDIPPARSSGTPIDYVRAMRAIPLTTLAHRRDVEELLRETIPNERVRGFLVTNITTRPAGLAWTVNLDAIEKNFETILDWPDLLTTQQFSRQTLFLVGENSTFVDPEHEGVIQQFFPASCKQVIENAGHWVHVENTAAFLKAVRVFLETEPCH
ncbi:MAG: alpha/beta fold hydrolase [Planctomycetaceae bacterium]|nr:alpha/beta fold hydrolase [Planctomycetaceae bacterium]